MSGVGHTTGVCQLTRLGGNMWIFLVQFWLEDAESYARSGPYLVAPCAAPRMSGGPEFVVGFAPVLVAE